MLLTRGKIRDLLSFAFAAWLSQRRRRRRRHNEGESRRLRLSDILFLAAVVVCWWRAEMSQCAKHWKERALKKKKKEPNPDSSQRIVLYRWCSGSLFVLQPSKKGSFFVLVLVRFYWKEPKPEVDSKFGMRTAGFCFGFFRGFATCVTKTFALLNSQVYLTLFLYLKKELS